MFKLVGKVKWFNAEKGYGFINRGEGEDIFVHYSQIMEEGYRSLDEGQEVQFDLAQTERGLQAKKVYKIGVKLSIKLVPNKKSWVFLIFSNKF